MLFLAKYINIYGNGAVNMDLSSDIIHFAPVCEYDESCRMLVGDVPDEGYQLTDSELDRVSIAGQIILGDWNDSDIVSQIDIVGLNVSTSNQGVRIYAHKYNVPLISKAPFINYVATRSHF